MTSASTSNRLTEDCLQSKTAQSRKGPSSGYSFLGGNSGIGREGNLEEEGSF